MSRFFVSSRVGEADAALESLKNLTTAARPAFSDAINIESLFDYLYGIVTNTRSAGCDMNFYTLVDFVHDESVIGSSERLIKLRTNGMSRAFYMLLQITQF